MATYRYKIFNIKTGQIFNVFLDTDNESEILNKFGEEFLIIEIKRIKEKLNLLQLFQPITKKEIAIFLKNLSVMLKGGLPIIKAMNSIIEETNKERFRKIFKKIKNDLERGNTLSYSLGKFPKYFSKLIITIVKVGETSGNLAEVLENIAQHIENEISTKRKVKSAMFYPFIVVSITTLAVLFLIFFVFPKFSHFYKSMNVELPMITKFFIKLPNLFFNYKSLYLLSIIAIFLLSLIVKKVLFIKKIFDKLKFKVLILGPLYKKINIVYYIQSLEILIRSGVGLSTSLKIASEAVPSITLQEDLKKVNQFVNEGNPLSFSLKRNTSFPYLVSSLIEVGEETGSIEDSLSYLIQIYSTEIENTLKNLTTMIEPFLLLIIGGVVLSIALAIYLPIFNLIKYLK